MTLSKIIALTPERWREAKRLRLEALLAEPSAFASSYEDESAFSDEVWIARLTTAYERDGNMTFFAEVAGELVGMAGADWSSKARLRHIAEIYGVYVSPRWRGRKIGARILRKLIDELRSSGQIEKASLTVSTDSLSAVRLYEKLGFEIVGTARRVLRVGGRFHDMHYMERHFES
ncbi:MAG: GNAT family N-acetyltransferase [Chloroflexi bacterium]|nr:GNAT family N-acetyltransferase [Chloroflexota bacterium]